MWLNKKTVSLTLIAVFFVAIDRFFKSYAYLKKESFDLIGGFFKFNYAENYYIAFSIPISGVLLNLFIGALILGLIVFGIKLAKQKKHYQYFLIALIVLGAVSNLYDRLQYGFVIDYLDLKYFTVFNVADAMISVSAFALMFLIIQENKKEII